MSSSRWLETFIPDCHIMKLKTAGSSAIERLASTVDLGFGSKLSFWIGKLFLE
jgi:hypothetical protein